MHRNLNTRSQQKESDSRSHSHRSHQRSHSRCSHRRSHSRRSHQRSHSHSSPQNRGRSLTKRTLTNQSSILQNQPSSSITPALNSGGVENQEIQELRNVILNLTQRLNNLTEKNASHEEPLVNRPNRSLSPILIREQKRELPLMSSNYKKTLHDEVVHILNNLNQSLQFDLSKTDSKNHKTIA
ncbi:hypothetical protein RhiirA1_448925 [Rhizophagus irregularis]|uniref:Uncharacterized protein n=1 Tax=Rhizophagus irregularis TaxID=588596 RepID=A0A2N0SIA3_9GLOM|nr:hypothetical protein RhiirA1_448925 [Rhizophagus irregularis]